jgi:hypothetical protein
MLAAQQLRNRFEMPVSRDQPKIMFKRERGDPQVVIGNRSACALKLDKQPGVVLRRFTARQQNSDGRFGE